ncbi:hypothetical protein V6N11_021939 [Hibiscus sabdariffa]|uniref:Secreted protein n=1 Tax=Hibiscus sabdariffa TaxID=183260 RepID=A0ABR2THQ3_9ROSI
MQPWRYRVASAVCSFCWLIWKRRCCLLVDDRYVDRGGFVSHGSNLVAEFIDEMKSDGLSRSNDSLARLCRGAPIRTVPFYRTSGKSGCVYVERLP